MRPEAEIRRKGRHIVGKKPVRPVDLEQFNKRAVAQLHEPVRGAHLVIVGGARRYREPERLIAPGKRIKFTCRQDQMIDTAFHVAFRSSTALHKNPLCLGIN